MHNICRISAGPQLAVVLPLDPLTDRLRTGWLTSCFRLASGNGKRRINVASSCCGLARRMANEDGSLGISYLQNHKNSQLQVDMAPNVTYETHLATIFGAFRQNFPFPIVRLTQAVLTPRDRATSSSLIPSSLLVNCSGRPWYVTDAASFGCRDNAILGIVTDKEKEQQDISSGVLGFAEWMATPHLYVYMHV